MTIEELRDLYMEAFVSSNGSYTDGLIIARELDRLANDVYDSVELEADEELML